MTYSFNFLCTSKEYGPLSRSVTIPGLTKDSVLALLNSDGYFTGTLEEDDSSNSYSKKATIVGNHCLSTTFDDWLKPAYLSPSKFASDSNILDPKSIETAIASKEISLQLENGNAYSYNMELLKLVYGGTCITFNDDNKYVVLMEARRNGDLVFTGVGVTIYTVFRPMPTIRNIIYNVDILCDEFTKYRNSGGVVE